MSPEKNYVTAMSVLLDLNLSEEQLERVAEHFARTKQLAGLLCAVPMTPWDEPAELYQPCPFPSEANPS